MLLPSAIHVSSIVKREASVDWETRYSIVFRIRSFAKYEYMCICVYVYYVRCSCCCLYFVLCRRKKKEGVETRVVITERAGRTKSVSYLCFPLISDER